MKSFYMAEGQSAELIRPARGEVVEFPSRPGASAAETRATQPEEPARHARAAASSARIAIYDGAGSAPRVDDVTSGSPGDLIEDLSARVYEHARALGGSIPYSVVREIAENFVHADFEESVVSVLDRGNTIRFSDQGPGFSNAEQALQPGYTTASREMKCFIRGVGSGLPLAKECLAFRGGSLSIERNLDRGAVVTVAVPGAPGTAGPTDPAPISFARPAAPVGGGGLLAGVVAANEDRTGAQDGLFAQSATPDSHGAAPVTTWRLTNRQKQVLALVMDSGSAGPSIVAKELSVGLSTAHRDLARLESLGLIVSDEAGKREITDEGTAYLGGLLNGLF